MCIFFLHLGSYKVHQKYVTKTKYSIIHYAQYFAVVQQGVYEFSRDLRNAYIVKAFHFMLRYWLVLLKLSIEYDKDHTLSKNNLNICIYICKEGNHPEISENTENVKNTLYPFSPEMFLE